MNTTRHERNKRLIGRASRLIALVGVALTALVALPAAMAATAPVEQILRITRLSPAPDDLALIESRLIFPAGARWEIDPDAGPLTLVVESGELDVVLGGGLARIERQQSPLQTAPVPAAGGGPRPRRCSPETRCSSSTATSCASTTTKTAWRRRRSRE